MCVTLFANRIESVNSFELHGRRLRICFKLNLYKTVPSPTADYTDVDIYFPIEYAFNWILMLFNTSSFY